ncbi:single-stranded DNA-binding protein [Kribbella sp. NBC_00709]|uniref:single-stranded DNA-binding protein n=1 Tax=Kribbella sp. NBC_00709 TaxID=2975972 RepID=UPI002E28A408|nr:single-stranded DNA-binding protein [Kribbella sp. NBC_00709]
MSVGDTYVTVMGWVGSDPEFKAVGQQPHATFRIGSTPRQFDKTLQRFVDKPTTWFTVDCWRILAQNAFDSIRVGQPIIVTGRLRTHEWTNDAGAQVTRVVLEAFSIGHDLSKGTTTFTKNPPRAETASATSPAFTPQSTPAETTTTPYPPDEYSVTSLPLPATTGPAEAEAA